MKKLVYLFAISLFALVSCEPEPALTLDKSTIDFSAEGGSQTIAVTANSNWIVLTDGSTEAFFTVSPTSGNGDGFITVTTAANTSSANFSGQIAVTCESRDMSVTRIVSISQLCAVGEGVITDVVVETPAPGDVTCVSSEGSKVSFRIMANGEWALVSNFSDVVLDKTSGSAGTESIVATVPACPVFEGRTIDLSLACKTDAGGNVMTVSIRQAGGVLVYEGETYHAAKMKDGKWWMTENLRYVPAGMTPADNLDAVTAGVWYPLVIDDIAVPSYKFSTDPKDIAANGMLYNTETALGLKTGELTADNCADYEGAQGICPAGWHIPTRADILGLVGKTALASETNPDAPYYDPTLGAGAGSAALLNADGFNAGAWGAISIANSTIVKGVALGAIKTYTEGMNTGYIAGSTLHNSGTNITVNEDGSLKNCQFVGFMPNMSQGTYNGAWNNYRNAVSVRCVKND